MNADFIPLPFPGPAAGSAPPAAEPAIFRPLTLAPAPNAARPAELSSAAESVITFKREGERVTHIQIRCACGELHTLECEY